MWPESNTPSKIEGAGGADVPQALFYQKSCFYFPRNNYQYGRRREAGTIRHSWMCHCWSRDVATSMS